MEAPRESLSNDSAEDGWREVLADRLFEIAKREDGTNRLAALTIRQSLRVFPLLAESGNFGYWKSDDVARHLLALHHAHLACLNHLRSGKELPGVHLMPVFYSANAAAEFVDRSENHRAANIARATSNAIKVVVFPEINASVNSASLSILFASSSASPKFFEESVEPEIKELVAGVDLKEYLSKPFWEEQRVGYEKMIWRGSFHSQVQAIIGKSRNVSIRSALNKMLSDYEVLQGLSGPRYLPEAAQIFETKAITVDRLGRDDLVKSLAELITHDTNTDHVTIGLLGDWGVGKSGVVALLKDRLKAAEDCETVIGEFNAWAYEHCGNFQAGIAHEAISALSSPFLSSKSMGFFHRNLLIHLQRAGIGLMFAWRLHWGKILGLILPVLGMPMISFWVKLSWIHAIIRIGTANPGVSILGGAAGIVVLGKVVWKQVSSIIAQPWTKELRTYLKLPDYKKDLGTIPVMRSQINLLCKSRLGGVDLNGKDRAGRKRRFVFVIDDLDRCSPEGIVKTFEAVRLVMDTPKVIVLIAVDQRVALAALALHYKDLAVYRSGESPLCIARDYLAKMIHLPIQLKMPDEQSTISFLSGVWKDESGASWVKSLEETLAASGTSGNQTETIERSNDEGLTELELAEAVTRIVVDRPRSDAKLPGLSDDQKVFFFEQTGRLGIRNPRQIKRLLNSYNLIRLLLGKRTNGVREDRAIRNAELGSVWFDKPVYPILLALLIQEFLNNTSKPGTRLKERGELFARPSGGGRWTNNEISILAAGWIDLGFEPKHADIFAAAEAMLEFVSPYVLPALDHEVEKAS